MPCPIATMDALAREFLAACHAHNPGAPCLYVYCGRDYGWHVREGVYSWGEEESALNPFYDTSVPSSRETGPLLARHWLKQWGDLGESPKLRVEGSLVD